MHKISYNCVICNQKFTEEAQLKLHIKAANHHNASFECYLCSNKYNQLLSLKLHFAHLHKPQKKRNFKCSFCRRTFLKRNEFEYHVNVVSFANRFSKNTKFYAYPPSHCSNFNNCSIVY